MIKIWFGMVAAVMVLLVAAEAQAVNLKTYYPNGKVQSEVTDASMKTYYENGQVNVETPVVNGVPAGVGKSYYENGKLMSETQYQEGNPVSIKQYDENGNMTSEWKI